MPANIFKSEKDALALLGTMTHMFLNFDDQFTSPDNEKTHTRGLNIHALLVDNPTGQILGMQKNSIHQFNNPLLHAEQLTLKESIEKKNQLYPRDPSTTSVENYYRNMLFNDQQSYDALKSGATIYTTLEPCPFCTSALLVSRVKRIVYITPDSTYGNSFYTLWSTYYKKYDIHYEQMQIEPVAESKLVIAAIGFLRQISDMVTQMGKVPGTLYFDSMKNILGSISEYFSSVTELLLVTKGDELEKNKALLNNIIYRVKQK